MNEKWRERERNNGSKREKRQFVRRRRHGIHLNIFHLNTHPNVWFACLCLFAGELFVRLDSHCQSNRKWYGLRRWKCVHVCTICIFRMNRGGEMLFGAFVRQPKLLGCRCSCFHCLAWSICAPFVVFIGFQNELKNEWTFTCSCE